MSRTHPTECRHGRIVDSGSFDFEPEGCPECEAVSARLCDEKQEWIFAVDELRAELAQVKGELDVAALALGIAKQQRNETEDERDALRARIAELEAERNHYIRDAQRWANRCAEYRAALGSEK